MPTLRELSKSSRLITFVGTGGVGKTSLSIAMALAAQQQGLKVAALTIDPSRRLTSILGLGQQGSQSQQVTFGESGQSLDIFYVDPQQIFRDFVAQHLNSDLFDKLSKNGIYQQISKNLRETHNFAAMYKTESILSTGDYDLVVLDTPPSDQVVDFFESPQRLQKFFSSKSDGESGGWLQWAQQKGLQVAEGFMKTLVGDDFVSEMEGFFQFVGGLRGKIHSVSQSFNEKIRATDSRLLLVFPPARDKISEADFLMNALKDQKIDVDGLILNRAYVAGLDLSQELGGLEDSVEKSLYNYLRDQKLFSEKQLSDLSQKAPGSLPFQVMIPEMKQSMNTMEDVLQFADAVESYWQPREMV